MRAVLTGIFGLMKAIFPHNYTLVVVAQTGLAIAQPFILNSATKLAVQWFPLNERAIAVGLGTLAQFLGIIIVMNPSPWRWQPSLQTSQALSTQDLAFPSQNPSPPVVRPHS